MSAPRATPEIDVLADEFYEALARQPLQLSTAELAVTIRAVMGAQLPDDNHLLSDLELSEADMQQALARLVERKVLLPRTGTNSAALEPALWPMFSTVLYPRTLGILRISGPNGPSQTLYLSWGSWQTVLNKVEPARTHLLVPLVSAEAVATAILRECGLDSVDAKPSPAAGPVDPAAVAQKATLQCLVLIVANPSRPREAAEALSWMLSDGQLWLLARRGSGAAIAPITIADLRKLLVGLAEQCARAGSAPA